MLNRWQLSTWSDQSEDWEDRGIEQAVKTISDALAFDHLPAGMNVRNFVCAFEMLTGKPLPAEVPVDCAPDTSHSSTPTPALIETLTSEVDSRIAKVPADDPRLAPATAVTGTGTGTGTGTDTDTDVPWS